jgi:hypothetical protein
MNKKSKPNGPEKMKAKKYEKELRKLQTRLCHLQDWVKQKGLRVIIIFEGRDAAGKGGTIRVLTERVSPRVFRVIALPAPSDREKPGYKLSLTYWKFEFSSEGEWVFDTGNSEGNFFYNWSELSISPVNWFRFGLVGQRTRTYQTDVDIQRGLLVGFSYKEMDFTTYVFNLDRDKPTWVFSVGVSF